MPKRLLRYTLSKLDYLDTDALDMDNLDLAMGKNNVFTLQNVGIKLQACPNFPYRNILKSSNIELTYPNIEIRTVTTASTVV